MEAYWLLVRMAMAPMVVVVLEGVFGYRPGSSLVLELLMLKEDQTVAQQVSRRNQQTTKHMKNYPVGKELQ